MVALRWNFDWITPDLAVGGAINCAAAGTLAHDHRIGAVVDMREEARDDAAVLAGHGIAFLHLPTPDRLAVGQADLDAGVAFARAIGEQGRKLLVHCQHGIGRSALLALCIMSDRGQVPMAALVGMKAARGCVSLSPE